MNSVDKNGDGKIAKPELFQIFKALMNNWKKKIKKYKKKMIYWLSMPNLYLI